MAGPQAQSGTCTDPPSGDAGGVPPEHVPYLTPGGGAPGAAMEEAQVAQAKRLAAVRSRGVGTIVRGN